MKSAAREWGTDRITINMILPGWHATALTGYQQNSGQPPFAPVLESGATMESVAEFVVAVAAMRNVSGQVFNFDSRILPL
jgi:3-oxoacyl-[acyl-carrier protein] reductase